MEITTGGYAPISQMTISDYCEVRLHFARILLMNNIARARRAHPQATQGLIKGYGGECATSCLQFPMAPTPAPTPGS